MEMLQRNYLDRFAELELGKLVADHALRFTLSITALFPGLLKSNRPDFQDVTFASLIVVILVVAAMQAPPPTDRAEYRLKSFFEPGLDLGIVGCQGYVLQRVGNIGAWQR